MLTHLGKDGFSVLHQPTFTVCFHEKCISILSRDASSFKEFKISGFCLLKTQFMSMSLYK